MSDVFYALLFLTIGIVGGWLAQTAWMLGKYNSIAMHIRKKELATDEKAQGIITKAHKEARQELKTTRQEQQGFEKEMRIERKRLHEREDHLNQRSTDVANLRTAIDEKNDAVLVIQKTLQTKQKNLEESLANIAHVSKKEAKNLLLEIAQHEFKEDLAKQEQRLRQKHNPKIKDKAQEILATTIQRLAVPTAKNLTSSTVLLENNQVKGKIIGKEGRNIKALERVTGVEFVLHESDPLITISSYDPLRREIAKQTLVSLVADGRIHPGKIEHTVKVITAKVDELTRQKGREALEEVEIFNTPEALVPILGQLFLRTSYGQNVLKHSVETAHIAGMLASELGADVLVAKMAGLLHDIGKAIDHHTPGGHVAIGMRLLSENGVEKNVINAMKSHHDDYPHESIESIIVQTADMISASRPGARKGTTQHYLHRLANLEQIANSFEGIEKSYIISGGRELRAFVNSANISDQKTKTIARQLAKRIEKEVKYPGEITVTVIRESRITTVAR